MFNKTKFFVMPILAGFAFAFILPSCTKTNIQKGNLSISGEINKIKSEEHLAKMPNVRKVNIKSIADEIGIAVSTSTGKKVKSYNQVFVLQVESKPNLNVLIEKAEIYYNDKVLIVNSLTNKNTLLFALSDIKNNQAGKTLLENINFSNRYFGYGLASAQNKNSWNLPNNYVKGFDSIWSSLAYFSATPNDMKDK